MKGPKTLFIFVVVLAVATGFLLSGLPRLDAQELVGSDDFARVSLNQYLSVLQQTNASIGKFGFNDTVGMPAAGEVTLGVPYRVFFIGLTDLQSLRVGGDETELDSLLADANTLWYPVLVNGVTTTKMEIVTKDGQQLPGEFGGTRTVQAVIEASEQIGAQVGGEEAIVETRLVKVPALQATFLYTTLSGGEEALTPAMVNPERFGLVDGNVYPVNEVLAKLKEAAADINPDLID